MNIHTLSLCLAMLGILGIAILLTATGITLQSYQRCRIGSSRWHTRNFRLKQLAAIACLFFLAMAASYAVLQEAWAILYLIIALKTGTWWFRFALRQGL